jgi:hypothetical protein
MFWRRRSSVPIPVHPRLEGRAWDRGTSRTRARASRRRRLGSYSDRDHCRGRLSIVYWLLEMIIDTSDEDDGRLARREKHLSSTFTITHHIVAFFQCYRSFDNKYSCGTCKFVAGTVEELTCVASESRATLTRLIDWTMDTYAHTHKNGAQT